VLTYRMTANGALLSTVTFEREATAPSTEP
jgi:hypothetical protein